MPPMQQIVQKQLLSESSSTTGLRKTKDTVSFMRQNVHQKIRVEITHGFKTSNVDDNLKKYIMY